MTTPGGPQDAVPQDAVAQGVVPQHATPHRRANGRPWPPPPPRARRAVGRLAGLHLLLVLALVVAFVAMAARAPACDPSRICFSNGETALFALFLAGLPAALLCPVGATVIVLLRRRVRRTGPRVLVGLTAEVGLVLLLNAAGLTGLWHF